MFSVYIVALVLASLVLAAIGLYALRQRAHNVSAGPFGGMMLATGLWSLAYAAELVSRTLPAKLLWVNIAYIGSVVVPLFWLFFAVHYVGKERLLTRQTIVLSAFVPILSLLLNWTTRWHTLFYADYYLEQNGDYISLVISPGVWYWVNVAYAYLLILIGTILLGQRYLRTSSVYRKQIGIILLAAFLPWFGNILYLLDFAPFAGLNLTLLSFIVTGLVMTWGLFRHKLLNLAPIARYKVVESMADGMIVLDKQERVVDVNPAAGRLIDRSPAELIGQPLAGVWPELTAVLPAADSPHQQISLTHTGQDRTIFLDIHLSPLSRGQNQLAGWLILVHDVSAQKEIEQVLREAKEAAERANESKSNFVSIVSHELKTPVTSILGYTEILRQGAGGAITEQQEKFLKIIGKSGAQMNRLIGDLIDVSNLETHKLRLNLQAVDVVDVVGEVVAGLQQQIDMKEQQLEIIIADDLPPVRADRVRLVQILTNLLGNAQKYTPPAGQIKISVQHDSAMVTVAVMDTGLGIKADEQEKVFQQFFRSTDETVQEIKGTGLGLHITQQLVEQQGGAISFSSQYQQGSTFTFTLPVEERGHPADTS